MHMLEMLQKHGQKTLGSLVALGIYAADRVFALELAGMDMAVLWMASVQVMTGIQTVVGRAVGNESAS